MLKLAIFRTASSITRFAKTKIMQTHNSIKLQKRKQLILVSITFKFQSHVNHDLNPQTGCNRGGSFQSKLHRKNLHQFAQI